jgi:exodeoxyribonuclease VII small subunit
MTAEETMTFENAYSRLEEILEKMSSGKLSLEDSLTCYEEADQLIGFCNKKLTQAEQKIEILIKNREGNLSLTPEGTPQTQEFNPSSYSSFKTER